MRARAPALNRGRSGSASAAKTLCGDGLPRGEQPAPEAAQHSKAANGEFGTARHAGDIRIYTSYHGIESSGIGNRRRELYGRSIDVVRRYVVANEN